VPYRKLTAERLAAAMNAAVRTPSYSERARALSAAIAREDGVAPVLDALRRI
jgi:UDP:flavonoid glycosyltransferase YjiC (YdhE family)